jgi:hypothetical protein
MSKLKKKKIQKSHQLLLHHLHKKRKGKRHHHLHQNRNLLQHLLLQKNQNKRLL